MKFTEVDAKRIRLYTLSPFSLICTRVFLKTCLPSGETFKPTCAVFGGGYQVLQRIIEEQGSYRTVVKIVSVGEQGTTEQIKDLETRIHSSVNH